MIAGEDPAEPLEQNDETERTVVSVQRVDDCYGSGHGVEIITYSDGTYEEIEY